MTFKYIRINYKTDVQFKEYLEEIEKLIPNITPVELSMIKKSYKKGLSVEDTINEIVNFDYSYEFNN